VPPLRTPEHEVPGTDCRQSIEGGFRLGWIGMDRCPGLRTLITRAIFSVCSVLHTFKDPVFSLWDAHHKRATQTPCRVSSHTSALNLARHGKLKRARPIACQSRFFQRLLMEEEPGSAEIIRLCQAVSPSHEPCGYLATVHCRTCGSGFAMLTPRMRRWHSCALPPGEEGGEA
jgi:hypothetical protein